MKELRLDALATFVHISDCHFSMPFEDPNRRNELKLWSLTQMVDGWLGESNEALIDLETFWFDLLALGFAEMPRIIVTGDLSAFGHPAHFTRFAQFAGAGDGEGPALETRDWLDRTIPGNHDHWPGTPAIVGKRVRESEELFATGVDQHIQLANGRTLRLVGIDTDADVGPWSRRRVFAIGSFTSEVARLGALFAASPGPSDEIRVLLLHHSWSQPFGWRLHIAPNCKRLLGEMLDEFGIRVLLSGHVHRARANAYSVTSGSSSHKFLEARCGTTTQWDRVPKQDIAYLGGVVPNRQLEANTLMVHQIAEHSGALWWETSTFVRRHGVEGFERDADPQWTAAISL